MITDSIGHLERYAVPKAGAILKFIAGHNCANLPDGEMEIEGRQLFVRIMSYTPKPAQENHFETHLLYTDVQYIVSGAEIMQTARAKDLTPLTDYDTQGDYQFFKVSGGTTSDLIVQADEFAVFYPTEAHRPSCFYEGYKGLVKKLVFKVKTDEKFV
ncbi:MAG: YhcH/YjgK/YiaL family protein [Candidatus Omnitrophica bacterium]|nr:YhcH/YjgK/YiaL family protein [Candidatus Omnitrophota bacterium]